HRATLLCVGFGDDIHTKGVCRSRGEAQRIWPPLSRGSMDPGQKTSLFFRLASQLMSCTIAGADARDFHQGLQPPLAYSLLRCCTKRVSRLRRPGRLRVLPTRSYMRVGGTRILLVP